MITQSYITIGNKSYYYEETDFEVSMNKSFRTTKLYKQTDNLVVDNAKITYLMG